MRTTDLEEPEKVQRRATRTRSAMEGLPREERPERPGLLSLEEKHLCGGTRRIYKMVNAKKKVNRDFLWAFCHMTRKGHKMKLVGREFKRNKRCRSQRAV